jgi:hemin uptake protein HemP
MPLPTAANTVLHLSSHRSKAVNARLHTEQLFQNGRELVIEHRGEEYRLRLTRNDKLILNK